MRRFHEEGSFRAQKKISECLIGSSTDCPKKNRMTSCAIKILEVEDWEPIDVSPRPYLSYHRVCQLPQTPANQTERECFYDNPQNQLHVKNMPADAGSAIETAIPVKSIEEEYEFLQRQQCSQCRGRGYKLIRQSLLQTEVGPCDKMETECLTCSAARIFYFDVTAVFEGYKRMFEST